MAFFGWKYASFDFDSVWDQKMYHRMLPNTLLGSEIARIHPNWSKTSRVCPKIIFSSLNRNFLKNFIYHNFQLAIPAENHQIVKYRNSNGFLKVKIVFSRGNMGYGKFHLVVVYRNIPHLPTEKKKKRNSANK